MAELNTEKNAKKWEDFAKTSLTNKDYDKTIEGYEKALDIYRHIGHRGQVGILRKQIIKIEALKNFHTENLRNNAGTKNDNVSKEKKADKMVSLAKNNVFKKNFSDAISNYEKALKLYEGLGFSFQERKISWEINKIKQLQKDQDNNKAINEVKEKSIAEERTERLEKQQIRQEKINNAKLARAEKEKLKNEQEKSNKLKVLEDKKKAQSIAEKQETLIKQEKKEIQIDKEREEKTLAEHKENNNQPALNKISQERIKKMALLKIEKEKNDKMLDDAQNLLDEAKMAADNRDFNKAKEIYNKASKMFQILGWKDQAITIKNEIAVLVKKEEDLIKKKKIEEDKARKIKEETEEIIKKDKEEKEKIRKLKEEEANRRSPEDRRKIEIAKLNISKGKTSESKEKYQQALKRYTVALEVYEEIQYNEKDISELKDLIEKLKNK